MNQMHIEPPYLAGDARRTLERLAHSSVIFADWFSANKVQLDDDRVVSAHAMLGVMDQFEKSIPLFYQAHADGRGPEQLQAVLTSANETCDDVVEFLSHQKKAVN